MELFAFGMLAGAIMTLILMLLMRIKDDGTMDQGQSGDDNSVDVCDGGVSDGDRNTDLRWHNYPPGSEERREAFEILINTLYTMRTIAGICRTEGDALTDAIIYIEEKEGL